MDYTNKALGLRTQTQIPLNVKGYAKSEEDLKNLGIGNNLAFIYEKGLIIYCIEEGTRYEWKEMEVNDIGLLDDNFIYPDNIITFGIDYSNKEYNFVLYGETIPIIEPGLQEVLNNGTFASFDDGSSSATILNGSPNNREITFAVATADFLNTGTFNVNNTSVGLNNRNDDKTGQILISEGITELNQRVSGFTTILHFANPTINSNILIPAKIIPGIYTLATLDDIPIIDGSETKINSGITTTKTGLGTIISPYVIEVNNNQKILTYPEDFTGINYTLTNSDFDTLIFINNGSTNVTITVPIGLLNKFYSVFIRQGTGEVSFVASGTTLRTPVGLRISLQNDHICLDKVGSTEVFHLTGNSKV